MKVASLFAYLPFAVALSVVALMAWPTDGYGDAFYFWYAGHLVASGGSPYEAEAWSRAGALFGDLARNVVANCTPTPYEAECVWVYPPLTAWLFAPFALVDVRTGIRLLEVFLFGGAVAGLVAIGRWMPSENATTRGLALTCCVASQPFIFEVHAGHFDGLGVLGVLLVAGGIGGSRALPVALGALLLWLKPHIYVLLAIVVLVVLIRRRAWATISWVGLVLTVVNVVGLAFYPEAVTAILERTPTKADLGWSTTWSFASSLVPGYAAVGIAVILALAAVATFVAVQNARRERQMDVLVAGSMALSLVVSPYVHPYDLMLVFPAFALVFSLAEPLPDLQRRVMFAASAATIVAGSWLAIVGTHAQDRVSGLPGVLPVVVLVLLAIVSWGNRSRLDRAAEGNLLARVALQRGMSAAEPKRPAARTS